MRAAGDLFIARPSLNRRGKKERTARCLILACVGFMALGEFLQPRNSVAARAIGFRMCVDMVIVLSALLTGGPVRHDLPWSERYGRLAVAVVETVLLAAVQPIVPWMVGLGVLAVAHQGMHLR